MLGMTSKNRQTSRNFHSHAINTLRATEKKRKCNPTVDALKLSKKGLKYLFSQRERDISIFDHVPDLALHGEYKQDDPIQQKNWPKHRHVENTEECQGKCHNQRFRECIPAW